MVQYWIKLLLIIIVNIISRIINKKIVNKDDLSSEMYSYKNIKSDIDILLKKSKCIDDIEINNNGQYYRFDRKNKKIVLKKKEEYSIIDYFICFHEIGHFIDSRNKNVNKLYIFIEIISILNMFIIMPILIIYSIICLYNFNIGNNKLFFLFWISIILIMIKIVSIIFIENRANSIAMNCLVNRKIIIGKDEKRLFIDIVCVVAIIEQISMQALYFIIIYNLFKWITYGF